MRSLERKGVKDDSIGVPTFERNSAFFFFCSNWSFFNLAFSSVIQQKYLLMLG